MGYNHNPQESLENTINTHGYTVRDTPKLSIEKDPFLIFEFFFIHFDRGEEDFVMTSLAPPAGPWTPRKDMG